MKKIIRELFLFLLISICSLVTNVHANKQKIQICVRQPYIPSIVSQEEWNRYSRELSKFLKRKQKKMKNLKIMKFI